MRLLTYANLDSKGLIGISEADEHAPQTVLFCIPIETYVAIELKSIDDFREYFAGGITTKINDYGTTKTIDLILAPNMGTKIDIPKFWATIDSCNIDFYLSSLNFVGFNVNRKLNLAFFYDGNIFEELENMRFVILEPDLKQLDQLFKINGVLFSDWR